MKTNISCKLVDFDSKEQRDSIELRRKVLRKPLGLDFTRAELEMEDQQLHFVAVLESKVVGILILVKTQNEGVKMRQVAIDEQLQGKGIGKLLVRFSENWASANHFSQIQLHARSTAVPFYISMNYELIGGEFLEVGIPHFKMKKILI